MSDFFNHQTDFDRCCIGGVFNHTQFFTPLFSTIVLFILDYYRLPESAVSVNPATAIVVLGGGLTNNQQNEIVINQFTESRLIKASQVYQQTGLPIIVSGKEAPWMAKWLQKRA